MKQKAICIDDKFLPEDGSNSWDGTLTEGKVYIITSSSQNTYKIIDNYGNIKGLYKKRFKLLEEMRTERIEEILK